MIDEKALFQQLSNPSTREAAFTRLVREYQQPLYWQIRRMVLTHDDADDVLQNTFIKAWSAIDSFRQEAGIQTWLTRIAINESLNHLNKKKQALSIDQTELSRLAGQRCLLRWRRGAATVPNGYQHIARKAATGVQSQILRRDEIRRHEQHAGHKHRSTQSILSPRS